MAALHRGPGVLASFQARPFPIIPSPHSCICLYASRAGELTASLPIGGLAQRMRMPWVGSRTGRGPGQAEQLCDGDREDGEREEERTCAHPHPTGWPEGRPLP